MADNSTVLYNGSVELIKIETDVLIANLADIFSSKIAIFRYNNEHNLVTIPISVLEELLSDSFSKETVFYIEKNWQPKIKKFIDSVQSAKAAKPGFPGKSAIMTPLEKYGDTNEMMKKYNLMSIEEREEILDKSIESLHELQSKKTIIDIDSIVKMVDVIANTFYANYANLDDNLSSENVKNNIHGIFVKTEWVTQTIIELFKNNGSVYQSFQEIDQISTGSYTIDNMSRGLLWFIGFSLFYNDYIDQGLVTKKIRGEFKDKYSRYYKKRLHDDMTSIERIIKGGLKKIEVDKDLPLYAIGALLYDIGKIPFIGYHDGDDEYDESVVKMHVLLGYNMILKTKKYPFTVAAMAAFHHEYYGGKGSYNFTNPIISKLNQKKRTDDKVQYFITYDEKEFKDGVALAFFPCKIIEIIDIYNALTHSKRHSHFEAMTILKKSFIAHNFKIDPLIFEIFLEFKQKCGLITAGERKDIDAIIY